MTRDTTTLLRLLQFTDSAFPVGTFSFSNGLETAAEEGLVHDAATLEAYTRDIARQAAFTDGVAALHAWRSYRRRDYAAIRATDRQLLRCKLNAEARLMTRRMGKKLAELSRRIFADEIVARWLEEIDADLTPGCYPVAQGIVFAACDLSEEELFSAHQYGVVNLVLSAALRCVRVSHFDTQRILFRAADDVGELYREARELSPDEMYTFTPQADILASLHEKGSKRLFMN